MIDPRVVALLAALPASGGLALAAPVVLADEPVTGAQAPAEQAPAPAVESPAPPAEAPAAPAPEPAPAPSPSPSPVPAPAPSEQDPAPSAGGGRPQPTTGTEQAQDEDEPKAPSRKPAPTPAEPETTPASDGPAGGAAAPGEVPEAAGGQADDDLGPLSAGVPSFFIDRFRIPPFLLPIYQAAGIEYGVRWEVLAAINEIETDYGRNLNVSSAGAQGWMQFMPSTWEAYGVDANRDGEKDPYNPVDAIFAAARYLRAAGAEDDLSKAIFAYNHADWYVADVLRRAKLIAGMPTDLVGSLSGLALGMFPVSGEARYAHDDEQRRTVTITSNPGAPVSAVQDGMVVDIGRSERIGRYVKLRDAYGNTYTYGNLGELADEVPQLESAPETSADLADDMTAPPKDPVPDAPATAGSNGAEPEPLPEPAPVERPGAVVAGATQRAIAPRSAVRSPLPAQVSLPDIDGGAAPAPAADASGGTSMAATLATAMTSASERLVQRSMREAAERLDPGAPSTSPPEDGRALPSDAALGRYFTIDYGVPVAKLRLVDLREGQRVVAGTILGRLSRPEGGERATTTFEIRPAGREAPRIDPRPILDGWRLLERTALARGRARGPLFSTGGRNATVGQILLMDKQALQRRVLRNPDIRIYGCGRRDIRAGVVDRRVLATLEFLAANRMRPTVTSLRCGHGTYTASGNVSHHTTGTAVDIAAINDIPITGHQGKGSITDLVVRRLLTLQGTMKPAQIITLMRYEGTDNTLAMADHHDHIHLGWRPGYDPDSESGRQLEALLKPGQWGRLAERLGEIDNPELHDPGDDTA